MNDALLTKTIPDFSSNTVSINGVDLRYLVGGDPGGPPVILRHGFLSTSYAWRKVMPALANAGLAILVPDMRGYGDSDKPAGIEGYDGRALAEEFRALVREIGFGAGRLLALVAHDMGAPPALLWAADHPEEVAGLLIHRGASDALRSSDKDQCLYARVHEERFDVVVGFASGARCSGAAYRRE